MLAIAFSEGLHFCWTLNYCTKCIQYNREVCEMKLEMAASSIICWLSVNGRIYSRASILKWYISAISYWPKTTLAAAAHSESLTRGERWVIEPVPPGLGLPAVSVSRKQHWQRYSPLIKDFCACWKCFCDIYDNSVSAIYADLKQHCPGQNLKQEWLLAC